MPRAVPETEHVQVSNEHRKRKVMDQGITVNEKTKIMMSLKNERKKVQDG